jgi:enoyl reductase-like protein
MKSVIREINDGHSPGGTKLPTRIVSYLNKQSKNFFSVFENLLPEDWCQRAYEYSIEKGHPWGIDF